MKKEKFSTKCDDGIELKGVLLIPENAKAIIQFNCGTATKKEFYLPFLEYLAENNYAICLWDYRGSGESAPEDLKGCTYTFSDYGTKDMPAIKSFLKARFPSIPLLLIGHSVGGQQIGFMNKLDDYSGLIGIAVSTGYYWHMPIIYHLKSWFFFYVFAPLSVLFNGYVAAKKFGIMEDIPKNVANEWGSWCAVKNYLFDLKFFGKTIPKGNFDNIPFPIHVFWATDDPIANKNSVPTFWSHIKSKYDIGFTKIVPSEVKAKQIDHFGFFKKNMQTTIWIQVKDQLDEFMKRV